MPTTCKTNLVGSLCKLTTTSGQTPSTIYHIRAVFMSATANQPAVACQPCDNFGRELEKNMIIDHLENVVPCGEYKGTR